MATRRDRTAGDDRDRRGDPVVLVHGYLDTAASPWWATVERRLVAAGYDSRRIHRVDLGSIPGTTFGSPREYARRVHDRIAAVAGDADREVDVLAHSMGGLSARWAIEELDAAGAVDDLVTLGTPHQGSRLAYWGYATPGGRAMVPGSSFLAELNGTPVPDGVEYTAVWSADDEAIHPSANAAIPVAAFGSMRGVRNVRLDGVGHMDLVLDPDVFDRVLSYLG